MENKHKIGFIKPCTGVMPSEKQRKELEKFGCTVHDDLQAALDDITRGDEVLVVISPAVLGSKIPEVMATLCAKQASLYSIVSEKEYNTCDVNDIVSARNELSERKTAYLANRTGKAKGGRPSSLSVAQKQEMRDLIDTGMTRDKIMSRFNCSASTISRVLNAEVFE